jgi:predicted molibdopterin-dependent oxidoreductase YjgC
MTRFTINGQSAETAPGTTILKAAREVGIAIPSLCNHPDLTPYGGCQLCMVEVKGEPKLIQSCTREVRDGMVIQTETPRLHKAQRAILELLLSMYYDRQVKRDPPEDNELIRWARHLKVSIPKQIASAPRYPVDSDPNPFIRVDMNKCILCTRCVRACAEIQGRYVWGIQGKGVEAHIAAGMGENMLDARCESCGACVAYCPTGALANKMNYGLARANQVTRATTICGYCGVGCTVDLLVRENKVIGVASNPNGAVNGMALCVKGRYGYDFIHHPDRVLWPRIRRYLVDCGPKCREGAAWDWVETDWETALQLTADRLREARDSSGPDSVGILTSAKCTNEENYLMNKLARQVMGTHNLDHCARL